MGQVRIRLLAIATVSLATIAGCASPPSEDDSGSVGESQDHLLAGRRLSEREAATLIRQAGFPESVVGKMLCTIKYESNFYERASNKNSNGTSDYGLFQVNSAHFHDAGCPGSATGLYSAAANTKCALGIYKSQGINAWYGYKKHRSECDSYRAPASTSVPAAPGADTPSGADTGGTTSTPAPSTPPPPATTPDPATPPDPADSTAGGCYSGTLEDVVPALTCVESKFDGLWYQCKDGLWYRGGDDVSGPYGACDSSHPL